MSEYTRENYEAYCEMFRTDPTLKDLIPSSYEHWVAVNEALDGMANNPGWRRVVADPRMADDYNAETGERDGIKYWERDGYNAPTALYNAEDDYAD